MGLLRGALRVAAVAAPLLLVGPAPVASADEVRDRQRPVLRVLDVENAWQRTKGDGVTVAVVDSGVDVEQQDLRGAVVTGPNMLESVDRGTTPARRHGTGMASLIAGRGHGPGNGDGIIGVAPAARILAVRAIAEPEDPGYQRYRSSDDADGAVARGIRHAADQGVDVINLSLGKYTEASAEREAIAYAIGKGAVVVSAVGNDGDKPHRLDGEGFAPYSYPASYPGVIAVAAVDGGNDRAPFSNRNFSVLVAAPGTSTPVAGPGNRYYLSDGTSDAAAFVSGVAALIRAQHRGMAPALVAQALVESGRDGRYSPDLGFGMVNATAALAAADRIAGTRDVGKKGTERFAARPPGPVTVVHHPAWIKPAAIAVTVLGLGGAAVLGCAGAVLLRGGGRPRGPGSPG